MNSAELEIIGLALNNKKLIPDLSSIDNDLFVDDFCKSCHEQIKTLNDSGADVNEFAVVQMMLDKTKFGIDKISGEIGDALMTLGSSDSYDTVKDYLVESKNKRDIKRMIDDAAIKIERGSPSSFVCDMLINSIISLSERSKQKNGMISIKDASVKLFNRMEELSKGNIQRINTGLKTLDKYLGGIESPDVVYIAARPSMGKTSLATLFLDSIAKIDGEKDNLIFSLETSDERIAEKIHVQRTKIYQSKFINGNLTAEDWDRLAKSANEIAYYNNIYINDRVDISAGDVLSECVKHNARKKIGSFYVDYLQLFKAPPGQWSREREVAEQSRMMKVTAKRIGCPAFILSQLNRSLENRSDKVPTMADMRDSGSIEQDADVILFIYRDEVYNPEDSKEKGMARIIIAKNKRGRTGFVTVGWDGSTTRFFDL